MLFRPPSTSEVEIWWVICSDSSLSSPLLITPSDISSHSAVHPPLDSECLLTLLLPSCPLLWIYLLLTPSPLPHFCHLPPFWFITSLSSSDSFRLCPSPPPSSLSTYVSLHLSFSTSPAPVICIPLSSPPSSPVTFNFPRYPLHSGALSSLHPQVQYSAYVGVGGLFSVVKLFCGGLLFWFMVKFSLGRKLLTMVGTLFISRPSFCYLPPIIQIIRLPEKWMRFKKFKDCKA